MYRASKKKTYFFGKTLADVVGFVWYGFIQ